MSEKINSKGEVESGAVNSFFDGLTRFSNEVKNAWNTLGKEGVEKADGTIVGDVSGYIKAKFEESYLIKELYKVCVLSTHYLKNKIYLYFGCIVLIFELP